MEGPVITVYIREQHWTARIAAWKLKKKEGVAITFFHTIYLHHCTRERFLQSRDWVRHEVKHVLQYRKEGYLIFLIKYLWYSIRFGYYDNPFEKEAREAESDEEILHNIRIL